MEDVWKDLSLSSLNHITTNSNGGSTTISAAQLTINGVDLQGFLACPLGQINRAETQSDETRIDYNLSKPERKSRAFGPTNDENARDRKRRRLMKNRESAARSRARKQAYTYELELEVAHLMKENSKLKQQQQKALAEQGTDKPCVESENQQYPQKYKLCRTLTAPF